MPTAVSTPGEIRKGKLCVKHADSFSQQLARLRDGAVQITVERKFANRSQKQNAYYFAVVLALISEHTGYHVDELHEHFKKEFLPRKLALAAPTGEVLQESVIGNTTTTLDTVQFTEYIERIRQVAAEMGIYIPDPEPQQ